MRWDHSGFSIGEILEKSHLGKVKNQLSPIQMLLLQWPGSLMSIHSFVIIFMVVILTTINSLYLNLDNIKVRPPILLLHCAHSL